MKAITLLSLLTVGAASAGEPYYDKSPMMPPPAPSLYQWFAGATVGYLIDNEEEMYTAHFGVDLPNQLAGWDQAVYLEIGYFEMDDCFEEFDDIEPQLAGGKGQFNRICGDFEVIPITLNYKLERAVTSSLNWYLGVGAGVALIDADLSYEGFGSVRYSDDDTVFYAQAFTGILYNVNPSFEVYGGIRYIYFDEPDFSFSGGPDVSWSEIEDAFDVHNDDVLVEVGARVNF
jgi:opacity protein-like surface antigen